MVMGHWVTDEMGRSDIAPNTASSGAVRSWWSTSTISLTAHIDSVSLGPACARRSTQSGIGPAETLSQRESSRVLPQLQERAATLGGRTSHRRVGRLLPSDAPHRRRSGRVAWLWLSVFWFVDVLNSLVSFNK